MQGLILFNEASDALPFHIRMWTRVIETEASKVCVRNPPNLDGRGGCDNENQKVT